MIGSFNFKATEPRQRLLWGRGDKKISLCYFTQFHKTGMTLNKEVQEV